MRIQDHEMDALVKLASRDLVLTVQSIGMANGPYDAGGSLFAIINNCIGNLDEENWKRIVKESSDPCSQPNCDCHVVRSNFFKALNTIRADHRKHSPAITAMRKQRN